MQGSARQPARLWHSAGTQRQGPSRTDPRAANWPPRRPELPEPPPPTCTLLRRGSQTCAHHVGQFRHVFPHPGIFLNRLRHGGRDVCVCVCGCVCVWVGGGEARNGCCVPSSRASNRLPCRPGKIALLWQPPSRRTQSQHGECTRAGTPSPRLTMQLLAVRPASAALCRLAASSVSSRMGLSGRRSAYQAAVRRMARSLRSLGVSPGSCLTYVSLLEWEGRGGEWQQHRCPSQRPVRLCGETSLDCPAAQSASPPFSQPKATRKQKTAAYLWFSLANT